MTKPIPENDPITQTTCPLEEIGLWITDDRGAVPFADLTDAELEGAIRQTARNLTVATDRTLPNLNFFMNCLSAEDRRRHRPPVAGRPDSNPKSAFGMTKPSASLVPPVAIIQEAAVFGLGAAKYGAFNWRETSVSARVYLDAALRHAMAWADGEEVDPESGVSHLAHARACYGIVLDAQASGKLIDDRPIAGAAAATIAALTAARVAKGSPLTGERASHVDADGVLHHRAAA